VVGEDDGLVELSDVIGVVREQLIAAQAAGRSSTDGGWAGTDVCGGQGVDRVFRRGQEDRWG
jgi:hypothetical protein